MRYFFILILFFCSESHASTVWEERTLFEGSEGTETLRVVSSTDTSVFTPIIEAFLLNNPSVNIEYLVAGSAEIYDRFQQTPDEFDLVVSSAMDLQLKLVNDGFALKIEDIQHPEWAQWRRSLFGFTLEPASIVINKNAFDQLPAPTSRQEMIEVLRENPTLFSGKIGTYDVRESGLGYLFATQDARASETYWRLMEIMGSLDTRLYCCSGEMIDDLAKGTIAISYNVLGSYAKARTDLSDKIDIIIPSDFPNTMMRTVFISRDTQKSASAQALLDFFVSSDWSSSDHSEDPLPSLRTASEYSERSIISLEPGLMVYLDRLKRDKFIREWENAIIH